MGLAVKSLNNISTQEQNVTYCTLSVMWRLHLFFFFTLRKYLASTEKPALFHPINVPLTTNSPAPYVMKMNTGSPV